MRIIKDFKVGDIVQLSEEVRSGKFVIKHTYGHFKTDYEIYAVDRTTYLLGSPDKPNASKFWVSKHRCFQNGKSIISKPEVKSTVMPQYPIDPTKPLELDNGVAVEYVRHRERTIHVRLPANQHYRRDTEANHSSSWNYNLRNGLWSGGNAEEYFVLRNRQPKQARHFDVFGPWFHGDDDLRAMLRGTVGIRFQDDINRPGEIVYQYSLEYFKYCLRHDHEFYKSPQFVARQIAGLAEQDV